MCVCGWEGEEGRAPERKVVRGVCVCRKARPALLSSRTHASCVSHTLHRTPEWAGRCGEVAWTPSPRHEEIARPLLSAGAPFNAHQLLPLPTRTAFAMPASAAKAPRAAVRTCTPPPGVDRCASAAGATGEEAGGETPPPRSPAPAAWPRGARATAARAPANASLPDVVAGGEVRRGGGVPAVRRAVRLAASIGWRGRGRKEKGRVLVASHSHFLNLTISFSIIKMPLHTPARPLARLLAHPASRSIRLGTHSRVGGGRTAQVTAAGGEGERGEAPAPPAAKPPPPPPQQTTPEPAWARREREAALDAASGTPKALPFPVYLLSSAIVAIAAIGSIFEWANGNAIFGVLPAASPLYTPILALFALTGLPTAGVLFFKAITSANAEAERQDRLDGYK